MAGSRRILTAELLSIGTELTVGETRDTNAGELARSLTDVGVEVGRIQAVPDDLGVVTAGIDRRGDRRATDDRPGPRGLAAGPLVAPANAIP